MGIEILPDSRTRGRRGGIPGPDGLTYIPVYCAGCGCPRGFVPERFVTHATFLCDPCAERFGPPPGTVYEEPDHVFRERVANAIQEEECKRRYDVTTPEGLTRAIDDPSHPFSKLAKDWQRRVRSTER